ncbi:MAG TPA: hypothetical protein P5102_05535 [Candidatus Competibacteraceae bacterium]|nr:hypothetical protein [Candidatus Competibacteraceae bacterium]HRZ05605.1 hypothetical protein [Candidatus Competibacteraceae bacterium]HSA46514.1 hypothetical protein [Candidatus Competibacteraceae bacterium]
MREGRRVVFDTNFFEFLSWIDEDCQLVDWLCEIFAGHGIADHDQLALMNYCRGLAGKLAHHDITDEQVAEFIFRYQGALSLQCILQDPSDLKLVVYVIKNQGAVFLTNDRMLLRLSDQEGLEHWCFKAVIHQLDLRIGGLFNEPDYQTQLMFDQTGKHPFFHYENGKHCPLCDSKNQCLTKSKPPQNRDYHGTGS